VTEPDIRVAVLGPLDVRSGGVTIPLSGRAATVIATLALSVGRPVGVDVLADRIWGERLPDSVPASLANHVGRLRRLLGASSIRTVKAAYLLDIDPDRVDLSRFRRMATEASQLPDRDKARGVLAEALDLWHGDPLQGVPSETLQRDVVPALVEEFLSAVHLRIGWDLADGRQPGLVAELRALTARYPLRETLWQQLIEALRAAGRHADALEVYHEIRAQLRERLGVEPSLELRQTYDQLLTDEPTAGAPTRPETPATEPSLLARQRRDLPGDIADFVGRDDEVRRVLAGAQPAGHPRIWSIDGMAGVGKTALAVRAAHLLGDLYPDGHLFIDLHGHTEGRPARDPADALETLLSALGMAGERVPELLDQRVAAWRSELANRRVLLVLDNARTAAQVRPLLADAAGCLTIVTSRRRLTDLDGAARLSLDVLQPAAAIDLFEAVTGRRRTADGAVEEAEATRRVVALCGYLPLAIRIAAARLAARDAWTAGYLAERLGDQRRRLSELATGDRAASAAFGVSYRQLEPDQQQLFRWLGLAPGAEVDAYVAAAVMTIPVDDAESMLEELVDAHLLQQPVPGRYRFHDLLRSFARQRADREETEPDRNAALTRILDYYLWTATGAGDHVAPAGRPGSPRPHRQPATAPADVPRIDDRDRALAWFEAERRNLVAAARFAAAHGWDEHACGFAESGWWFLRLRGYLQDWVALEQLAVASAERLGDVSRQADALRVLGVAYYSAGGVERAIRSYHHALELYHAVGDRVRGAVTHNNIGLALHSNGDHAAAIDHYIQALAGYGAGETGPADVATTETNLAMSYWRLGHTREAMEYNERALAHYVQFGDQRGQGGTLSNLGEVHASLGHAEEAIDCHRRALSLMHLSGDAVGECDVRLSFGHSLQALHRPEEARAAYRQCLAEAHDIAHPLFQAHAHKGLAETLYTSDRAAARHHWESALAIYTDLARAEARSVADRLRALD
jgi:DNA-binding SARP family transcriptional activator/Tfp pilus assembly protein PilF